MDTGDYDTINSPFIQNRFPFFTSSPWYRVAKENEETHLYKGFLKINLQGVILDDEKLHHFLSILKKPDRLTALSMRGCFTKNSKMNGDIRCEDMCGLILENISSGVDDLVERNAACYLETLDLGFTFFCQRSVFALQQLLSKKKLQLTNLGLQQCSIEAKELSSIISLLPSTSVRFLDISKNSLDLDCFQAIADAIIYPKSLLHSLDCSMVRVPVSGHQKCWAALCKALSSSHCQLKTLYLDGVINIRFRQSSLFDAFSNNCSLRKLTLDQSIFSDEGLQKLGMMVRHHRSPTFLSIRNCRLGTREFQVFLSPPSMLPTKRPHFGPCFLDIGWNTNLKKHSLLHLLPLLRTVGDVPPALTGIGLQGVRFSEFEVPSMLLPTNIHQSILKPESFEHLITLDVSRTGLSTEYVVEMARAFASSWRIGSICLPRIFKPPLKHLNLNNNPLGATGAEGMAEEMSSLEAHPLRSLCMSGCHIGQRGSMALVNWLENDDYLTYLELHPQDRYPGFPLNPKETIFHEPLPLRTKLAFLSVVRRGGTSIQNEITENEVDPQSLTAPLQIPADVASLPTETVDSIFSFCEFPIVRTVQFVVDN